MTTTISCKGIFINKNMENTAVIDILPTLEFSRFRVNSESGPKSQNKFMRMLGIKMSFSKKNIYWQILM